MKSKKESDVNTYVNDALESICKICTYLDNSQTFYDSDNAAASINTAKVLGSDVAAGEELPGEEKFIAFEWVDYDNNKQVKRKSNKKVKRFSLGKVIKGHPAGSNQYTGKYGPAWLHGEKEKQSMNDPNTVAEEFERWGKDVLAIHIISLDVYMQRCDDGDESPLRIASADQEQIKKDLPRYNHT
eukprot:g44391.t1